LSRKWTNAAIDLLAKEGFDPQMGARPMARKINSLIKVPLSKKILFESVPNGSIVTVDVKDGEVVFGISMPPMLAITGNTQPMVDENGFIKVPAVE
jgi:ATP-dependent Clp protease ATP-binding subunit ClpA